LTSASNVRFIGGELKHSGESQLQSRYEKDDYESLATRIVLAPMQWVAEKSALSPQRKANAEATRSRGDSWAEESRDTDAAGGQDAADPEVVDRGDPRRAVVSAVDQTTSKIDNKDEGGR
jgi:hypothetical protein